VTSTRRELYSIGEPDEHGNVRVTLHLHEAQTKVWEASKVHRFVFYIAGTQGGKTSFGPWWQWDQIQANGGGDHLAVTASFDLMKLKLLPELLKVYRDTLKVGRWWAGSKVLEIRDPATGEFWAQSADDPMWARVIVRSAQAEGGLESASAISAWLDECGQPKFGMGAWLAILRRLSLSQGKVLGTTTPYDYGWLKREVFDRWQKGDPDYFVVQAASTVNPSFPIEEYEAARQRMSEHRFRMFYQGKFERPEGAVYPSFDESRHGASWPIIHSPGEGWSYIGGLDFGWNHPTCALLGAISPDGTLFVIREHYESNELLGAHFGQLAEWEAQIGTRIQWFADPSGKQQIEELCQRGLYVTGANRDILAGVDAVTEYLQTDRIKFVIPVVPNLVEEFGEYVWVRDRDTDTPSDKPRDLNNHAMDALRYMVMGARTHVRAASHGVFDEKQVYQEADSYRRYVDSGYHARRGGKSGYNAAHGGVFPLGMGYAPPRVNRGLGHGRIYRGG